MRRSFSFETLLFDIDGTLIDSNGAHAQAWTQSLAEHGIVVPLDRVRRLIGKGADKLLPAVAGVSQESAWTRPQRAEEADLRHAAPCAPADSRRTPSARVPPGAGRRSGNRDLR